MDLAAAVAPTTLARQRTLPVADPLQPLLPEGGLARGRTVACRGVAATSLALALAAEATDAGAWLAVVDVPWLGVEAAAELGVPLERLVRVEPATGDATAWADLVAAVLDGFELVVTRVPRRVNAGDPAPRAVAGPGPRERAARRRRPRAAQRRRHDGGVDCGVGGRRRGCGHLRGRRVTVVSSGRRIPRPAGRAVAPRPWRGRRRRRAACRRRARVALVG